MKKPAQADLAKPKMVDEKTYHWCSFETRGKCEGAWHHHLPSTCQGKAFKFKAQADKHSSPQKGANANEKAKVSDALANVLIIQDKD